MNEHTDQDGYEEVPFTWGLFFKGLLLFMAIGTFIALSGCATQNAMPLGNDMMQIDVSAAPVYGRAGAQRMAMETAAKATVQAGYDKFIVMGNNAWNEQTASGGSYGSFNAMGSPGAFGASGGGGSFFGTQRRPESSMVIKMFHNGEPGSEKAIDARAMVGQQEQSNSTVTAHPIQ